MSAAAALPSQRERPWVASHRSAGGLASSRRDVRFALGKLAERLSTGSVRLARMILIQASRNAMVNDLVVRVPDPGIAVRALRDLVPKQAAARAKAGTAWKENDLVFRTNSGGPLYAADVRMLRPVTRTAAIARGPLFESRGKADGGQSWALGYQVL